MCRYNTDETKEWHTTDGHCQNSFNGPNDETRLLQLLNRTLLHYVVKSSRGTAAQLQYNESINIFHKTITTQVPVYISLNY